MIKKLYDKCITWAGYKYAKQILAIEAFIESSFFPIPPDVMIVPMVISKRNEFIQIALIATIFSVLGALFGYYIGYSGWGNGQLEGEMERDHWILSDIDLDITFDKDSNTKWNKAFKNSFIKI